MLRIIMAMVVGFCFSLESMDSHDKSLSDQPWSDFGGLSESYACGRKNYPEGVFTILKIYSNPDSKILDLGSGTGIATRQLHENGFKNSIGADRDLLMIEKAQTANTETCSIEYKQEDVTKGLKFSNAAFDVVTAFSAFHWFSNPSSINEVARILKSHGYYFIVQGGGNSPDDKDWNTIKKIVEDAIKKPLPHKKSNSISSLEAQNFKIIADTTLFATDYYTIEEYRNYVQSRSIWNFVKEACQVDNVLVQIDHYLSTISCEQGKIKQERPVRVILAQKQ